jgi:hypothetical protein
MGDLGGVPGGDHSEMVAEYKEEEARITTVISRVMSVLVSGG